MRLSRFIVTLITTLLPAFPAEKPLWETLLQKPLPADSEPTLSVFSLPLAPAQPVPRAPGAGHTHAGPVFGYIVQGEIENQVEPDPPHIYKPGEFFYETPGHIHRFMRNLSQTEPASVIAFQADYAGKAAPAIKLLLRESLVITENQEVRLLRLTLPPGTSSTTGRQVNPGIVYVLDGKIAATADPSKTYSPGDLFAQRTDLTFRNVGGSEPARLLLYQAISKSSPSPLP